MTPRAARIGRWVGREHTTVPCIVLDFVVVEEQGYEKAYQTPKAIVIENGEYRVVDVSDLLDVAEPGPA